MSGKTRYQVDIVKIFLMRLHHLFSPEVTRKMRRYSPNTLVTCSERGGKIGIVRGANCFRVQVEWFDFSPAGCRNTFTSEGLEDFFIPCVYNRLKVCVEQDEKLKRMLE